MEVVEDIVIVGAGIAGLTTSLGLHRLGLGSLVLESSDSLRVTGFAFTTWTNAWKALDALGIGESLRQQHHLLIGVKAAFTETESASELLFQNSKMSEGHEIRCVRRKLLLGTLEKELPSGTIRYSSKVVSIEDSGYSKLVHLANGTIIKAKGKIEILSSEHPDSSNLARGDEHPTKWHQGNLAYLKNLVILGEWKVLIGCDGVNSVVAKSLGLKKPAFPNRHAMRGFADFKDGHGFEPKMLQYIGKGIKYGLLPCDDHIMYWFFTYTPSPQDNGMENDPIKMKQYLLSKLGDASEQAKSVFETTKAESIESSPLRYRHPWELIWGNISKGNACVAGDALHPMTPDLGQGGCSALEDGIILARCLGEALKKNPSNEGKEGNEEDEYKKIKMGLERYAKERKWRGFGLISTAYMIGFIHQSDGKVISFLRDNILGGFLNELLFKRAVYDCGKLE